MKKLMLTVMAAALATVLPAANTLYVAQEHPAASDEPGEGRGTADLPYKTIQAAVTAVEEYGTVKVDRGTYADEPTDCNGQATRVVIAKSLTLESIRGRDVTHIVGAKGAGETGIGEGGVRGIRATVKDVIIRGFTIRDCGTSLAEASDDYFGGGVKLALASDCLVDCVVSNCVAYSGGAVSGGTVVGCWLDANAGAYRGSAGYGCSAVVNTLVTRNFGVGPNAAYLFGYTTKFVGCTLAGNDVGAILFTTSASTLWNTVVFGNRVQTVSGSSTLVNCAFPSKTGGCSVTTDCKADMGAYDLLSPRSDDWRPLATAGLSSLGKAAWLEEVTVPAGVDRYVDAFGRPIAKSGDIVCGAIQATAATASGAILLTGDFAFDGPGAGGLPADANYLRPTAYPQMLKVKGAGENLVHYVYGTMVREPRPDDWIYVLPPPANAAASVTLEAKYAETVVYADAKRGNDSWDGSSPNHEEGTLHGPTRTLQAAVDATPCGTGGYTGTDANARYSLVRVNEGVYDDGGAVSSVLALSNRVCVTGNRRLRILADKGPEKTFIVGAADPESNGYGDNAMRCLALEAPAIVQGFTLTGGYTVDSAESTNAREGAGVRGYTTLGRIVADCVISNNFGAEGAAVHSAKAIRCRIVGNSNSRVHGMFRSATGISCVLARPLGANAALAGYGSTFHNCTFDGSVGGGSYYYNSLLKSSSVPAPTAAQGCYSEKGCGTVEDRNTTGEVEFADAAGEDWRLLPTCAAFGKGLAGLETIYQVIGDDMYGDPLLFRDGGCTPGACQLAADRAVVYISAPASDPELLVVTGGTLGKNAIPAGGSVTLGPDPSCGRTICGYEVDGKFVAGSNYTYTAETAGVIGVSNVIAAIVSTNWYVNAVSGSDLNDGFTEETAKLTLAGVMSAAVRAGDTVNAAEGTYDDGEMKQRVGSGWKQDVPSLVISNRVVVPAGVTLVATGARDKTVIEGRSSDSETGCGPDALRCVFLEDGAKISGFTVRGGRTAAAGSSDDVYAGGILGLSAAQAMVENCFITNCVGVYGGAGYRLTLKKCRLIGNRGTNQAAAAGFSSFYDCVLGACTGVRQVDYFSVISNCTVGSDILVNMPATPNAVYDSLLLGKVGDTVNIFRCALRTDSGAAPALCDAACIVTNAAQLAVDADYAPVIGSNAAIDAIPLADEPWLADETDVDGRQRVYNGARDLGAVEADWRAVYARILGGRDLSVVGASPAVTAGVGRLLLPSGRVEIDWGRPETGETRYGFCAKVEEAGALQCRINDAEPVVLTAADGERNVTFAAVGRSHLTFDFAGETDVQGCAALYGFRRYLGMMLIVR